MKVKHLTQTTVLLCSLFLAACGGNNSQTSDNTQENDKQKTTEVTDQTASTSETDEVVNYLGTVKSIDFDGTKYNLTWSHPPQGVLYIQEYMPDGQVIEQYEDIFILDLYKDANTTLKDAVKEKTDWLNDRKKTDPTVNYKVMQNSDGSEYIVDLIISDGDIVEWDVIRYADYKENGEKAGVRTFTMSKRGYKGMSAFVDKMMKRKQELMKEFSGLPFPEIKLQK